MNKKYLIRELKESEIYKLKSFAPVDWNFKLDNFLFKHFHKNYFLPIVTVKNGEIVAFANAIINGNVGWAGNIIVSPSFQGQGLGYAITEQLIEKMLKRVESIVLIATKMGEGLYTKFGFKTIGSYNFFENKKIGIDTSKNIIPFENKYLDDVFHLDIEASCENRQDLLKPFLKNAWLYVSDKEKTAGFYIHGFGDGMIIASDEIAGKALLEFKHSRAEFRTVVPSSNSVATDHLKKLKIKTTSQANRMILGKEIDWKPENIYSRIAGYCG